MVFQTSNIDNIHILTPDDLLLATDQQEMIAVVEEALNNGQLDWIINLEKIDYMSSTGLNFLISLFTRVRSFGGELILTNLSDKIEQVLLITRLYTTFVIKDNLEEATHFFETAQTD